MATVWLSPLKSPLSGVNTATPASFFLPSLLSFPSFLPAVHFGTIAGLQERRPDGTARLTRCSPLSLIINIFVSLVRLSQSSHSQLVCGLRSAVRSPSSVQPRPPPWSQPSSPRLPRSLPVSRSLFSATLAVPASPAHVCLTCSATRLTCGFWEDAGVWGFMPSHRIRSGVRTVNSSCFTFISPSVVNSQEGPGHSLSTVLSSLQRSAFRRTSVT